MQNKLILEKDKLILQIFGKDEKDKKEYTFSKEVEYAEDGNKIVLLHGAIVNMADELGVKVSEPNILMSYSRIHYVVSCSATYNDRTELGIGEATKENLVTDIAQLYPFITAYTRAYDRSVLAVLGFAGKIFSTSEITVKNLDDENDYGVPSGSSVDAKNYGKNDEDNEKDTKLSPINDTVTEPNTPAPTSSTPVSTPVSNETKKSQTEKPVTKEENSEEKEKTSKEEKDIYGKNYGEELDPEKFVITSGLYKKENITVAELYKKNPEAVLTFAKKRSDTTNEEFNKNVFACRRQIAKNSSK